jgi:transportin-3
MSSNEASQIPALPSHSTNVDEELHRVRLALGAVFSPGAQSSDQQGDWFTQRQLADRYLTSFQTQPISWMVCDRLLQDGNEQECFFAAQTLHTKCRVDIQELPVDSLPSLRDSLLAHVNRYS